MTVCIAALAENEKSVVLASDKMISKQMPPIEYEHDVEKIIKVAENFYILIAGTMNNAIEIINKVKPQIRENQTPNEKFEKVKKAYADYRDEKIVDEILRSQGFHSFQDFQGRQQSLNKDVATQIQGLIGKANLQTVMTLVAIDKEKCHLKVLIHPGSLVNPIEYATTGSGELHATQSLISANYKKSEDLDAATYLVFEAKKRAEVAPGVGPLTEMIVLSKEENDTIKERRLTTDDLEKLAEVYESVNARDTDKIKAILTENKFHL